VCIEAIRKLSPKVAITCRDRISAARLTQHSGRQVTTTADLAFLLDPDEESPAASRAIRWIEQRRASGRVVYGVNVNEHLTMEGSVADQQNLLTSVAETLNHLHRSQSGCFVFIPHDRRAPRVDSVTGANLAKLLDEPVRDDFMILQEPFSAAEVKGVAGHCDMVLTGRMHVAVAALGRGVPVACITYQGKFEGLLEHFGIASACISPEAAMHKNVFFNFVETQIARREVYRQQIASRLPAVVTLAAANLEGIR
jgi:polysaccharide pyruvyl transferase WcaK-like protein